MGWSKVERPKPRLSNSRSCSFDHFPVLKGVLNSSGYALVNAGQGQNADFLPSVLATHPKCRHFPWWF